MLPDGLMVDNVYKDIHIYKETKNQNIDFYEKIPVDGDFIVKSYK